MNDCLDGDPPASTDGQFPGFSRLLVDPADGMSLPLSG